MSKHNGDENEPLRDEQTAQIQKISTFRRLAPQVTKKSYLLDFHFNKRKYYFFL